ncbi:hypothetical protein PQO03_00105 [Lentisphaera profundi]|uniref:HTH-type transcriptional regulator n=1 Tax=Lentisphaera profundi TaxID=1658616 RepID=A0ABY7VT23_9BACT|nr:MarR family transcriptional regulator [Lentisphaera profundi]WDE96370.1 hypothetical protein PQO03_00105 [Lentisphaera profundi]
MSAENFKITPSMEAYILHWGEMGPQWGVNRTVAQIHALLYLADESLDADTITKLLGIARSNVSNSLRELKDWKLIKSVPVLGRRKEHFTTDKDPWKVFQIVLEERRKRELDPTISAVKEFIELADGEDLPAHTLKAMKELSQLMEDLAILHDSFSKLPLPILKKLVKGGSLLKLFTKS